ncbi:putative protein 455L [Cricket iridovirus]|uniref:455L n=2 Tax=Iridovirus TaxID=10487 RepID=Q91F71_IIV6|nr:455L [Invertebrate iridescent virus 6]AAK82315.1 455L [Invertebrate iridescent virus 6]QMS79610.1 hypothetical protein IIV6-T1_445 [Invertebrate iridescent virus 6]QNH08865.1 455L [Invertebrate iridescent virus Kaz2018]UIB20662.1 putative protein 455L [Cricket iridovirus]
MVFCNIHLEIFIMKYFNLTFCCLFNFFNVGSYTTITYNCNTYIFIGRKINYLR